MSTSSPEPVTRRDILTLAWKSLLALSGVIGLGWLWRFLSYQPNPAPTTLFDLGPASGLPTDKIITVPDAEAVLLPTEQGLKAFSLVCPHLGCELEAKEDGFVCPCHGSEFELDGRLRKGPADTSMTPLSLEISDQGHYILDNSVD